MPSLYKLFPRDDEKKSVSAALELSAPGESSTAFDPWRAVMKSAPESREGLTRSLHWLCVFSRSGVDIPVSTFSQYSALATQFKINLTDSLLLVEAALSSTWLKSLGRQEMQTILSNLHSSLASHVLHSLRTKNELSQT
jgi:hypothetical protein